MEETNVFSKKPRKLLTIRRGTMALCWAHFCLLLVLGSFCSSVVSDTVLGCGGFVEVSPELSKYV